MRRINFLFLCYLSFIGMAEAKPSEFKKVRGWRLDQYIVGREPLVVRFINTILCNNNLSSDNTS